MKLRRLVVAGFGRLGGRTFDFGDNLTVVYGPNEAGKSTLSAAIVASLYGINRRKEAWRPWDGGAFATTLWYELHDGQTFEVQRDYTRDAKGVHIYDRDGNDMAAHVANGKSIAPGDVHLHVPLDAFLNASCVLQQGVAIDGRGNAIATALARALDGGPKEDAALGALKRLEDARKSLVGTARSTVNNPLRAAREKLAEHERRAAEARAARDDLAAVRERRAQAVDERRRARETRTLAEREARAIRAAELRSRLDDLHTYRETLAAANAERERYDDVAHFPADRIGELDAAFYAWQSADVAAETAEGAAAEARLHTGEREERRARQADVGTLDDLAFDALCAAAEQAESARATASAAFGEAAAARHEGKGGSRSFRPALAVTTVFAVLCIAAAIAHWWSFAEEFGLLAAVVFAVVMWRSRDRRERRRVAERKQRAADDALAAEQAASAAVAAVLERLHVANLDDLIRRRERLAALDAKAELAERTRERADEARANEVRLRAEFDALADAFVPDVSASRAERRIVANERATRRRERDGIESGIAMLAVQRSEILRGDDEFALVAERDALAAAGILPADTFGRGGREAADARIAECDRLVHDADLTIAGLTNELERGEARLAPVAAVEEDVVQALTEVERLCALERALDLASTTLERLTTEAHAAFARRLETYAADHLHAVTAGRYGEIRVDPKTLDIRVRVPENHAIVELDALSAGTRDQVYLIVRFAMARMFAEGLETPPLLLDDPFAFWDDARIERCLPIIAQNAFGAQTILFTASRELAAAAAAAGAHRIDLASSVRVATS